MKVKKLTGSIFKAYFEYDFDEAMKLGSEGPIDCVVIAKNIEEAMAKVKSVFPHETISHISRDRDYSATRGKPLPDTILL